MYIIYEVITMDTINAEMIIILLDGQETNPKHLSHE